MSKPMNADESGVAISGYDPVSYFSGEAHAGNPEISASHNGATYRFATAANRDTFVADPDRYTPEYGGFCATAMSEGTVFEVDPTNFKVDGERLFLFYRGEHGDTLPEWNADHDKRRADADRHWAEDTYTEHE